MREVNNETVIFNSPSRNLLQSVVINDKVQRLSFRNHTYQTSNPLEIDALRQVIKLQDYNPNATKFVMERDEYELMKASEPSEMTLEYNGVKHTVSTEDIKEAFIEKLKTQEKAQKSGEQEVIVGSRGSGKKQLKKEAV